MTSLIRWRIQDRFGNNIYLTQERWEHIINPLNHPEMEDYEEGLKETVQTGTRKQDSLNPQNTDTRKILATCLQTTRTSLPSCCSGFRKAELARSSRIILLSPPIRKK